jgi:hypothetical protein
LLGRADIGCLLVPGRWDGLERRAVLHKARAFSNRAN